MSIWIILWLFLSGALLYFLGWTLFILFRQKQAWKSFSTRKKLRYRTANMMASPEMGGALDGRSINFLIGEHFTPDGRSSRKLTAVEVQLLSKMPFEGGIASGGMVSVVQSIRMKEEIKPNHPKWDKNYIAVGSSGAALEAYLTPERMDALTSLMKIRNGWVILIFRAQTFLLRFDTPDPLDSQQKLEKITDKLLELAELLELKPGEDGRLKLETTKKPIKEKSLAVDERDFKESDSFQLEDDQPPKEESETEKP